MEMMTPALQEAARDFLKLCRDKFGWGDLKDEVIMDVGCGPYMCCGRILLGQYPDIRVVISIDKDPEVMRSFRSNPVRRMECDIADIEKRDTLSRYLGRMTKVVSTSVFHELSDIRSAFQNVYDLLRPGGEAALQFLTRSSTHEWFIEMIKMPKWRDNQQSSLDEISFLHGMGSRECSELMRNIGFQVVECSQTPSERKYDSNEDCLDFLIDAFRPLFRVPLAMAEEFKKDACEMFLKVSERDEQGRIVFRTTELILLLIKPKESPRS